jgi:lipopolysaccharide/colanic/teichoic acid biosynthesis glycosyltransferase
MRVHAAEGIPLLGLAPARLSSSSLFLKRVFDIVLSSVALVPLLPLFVLTAAAIRLDSSGPVFFRQVRMGHNDRTFTILKFRTMVADADEHKADVAHLNKHLHGDPRMFKAPGDPRVTRVGGILRRYSLDELPQLFNVLRSEMSLVGPRPLILDEDQHVDGWGRRRLDLKPGITGLWQVLGRDDIPFEEMVALDYRYVTTWSLSNDLQLMVRTLPAVFRKRLEHR